MVFESVGRPLRLVEMATPQPNRNEILLKVSACGVCRTDLHIVEGDLDEAKLPLILGHQIVANVEEVGADVRGFRRGDRVGVPWLGRTCQRCSYCCNGLENLCAQACFTGYHRDGGFAEFTVADQQFCFPLPAGVSDVQAAPLLCAGFIGYRAYTLARETTAGPFERLGLYGFGSAAHILCRLAGYHGKQVYAFSRPGDTDAQRFACELGAVWAGGSDMAPPEPLDAAIIFASVGALIPLALRAVRPAGAVICGGIHMSDIPSFPYRDLWEERTIKSVANLTRNDGRDFLEHAGRIPLRPEVTVLGLEQANQALSAIREGAVTGSVVLKV